MIDAEEAEQSYDRKKLKEKSGKRSELRAHDPGFDFRLPDHVGRFQGFNANLALLRSAILADPSNFIAGAAVLALQPNGLSHAFDPRRHYQARSGGGNFIGAAVLRFDAGNVWKHFYRHGKVQPLFMAFISGCCNGCCAGRRSWDDVGWFHDLSS